MSRPDDSACPSCGHVNSAARDVLHRMRRDPAAAQGRSTRAAGGAEPVAATERGSAARTTSGAARRRRRGRRGDLGRGRCVDRGRSPPQKRIDSSPGRRAGPSDGDRGAVADRCRRPPRQRPLAPTAPPRRERGNAPERPPHTPVPRAGAVEPHPGNASTGWYRVRYRAPLFREPNEASPVIAYLPAGTKVQRHARPTGLPRRRIRHRQAARLSQQRRCVAGGRALTTPSRLAPSRARP